jgi:hypothetical protein
MTDTPRTPLCRPTAQERPNSTTVGKVSRCEERQRRSNLRHNKDGFAECILSPVEGLARTLLGVLVRRATPPPFLLFITDCNQYGEASPYAPVPPMPSAALRERSRPWPKNLTRSGRATAKRLSEKPRQQGLWRHPVGHRGRRNPATPGPQGRGRQSLRPRLTCATHTATAVGYQGVRKIR